MKTNTLPTTVCDEEWYIYIYIYTYTYTLKENDHANDKNARILMNTTNALLLLVVVVVVVVVVVSFLYYACQCVLVTLLPSALSMISPRWVMTINALMTAHSLTPTRDKSSTR